MCARQLAAPKSQLAIQRQSYLETMRHASYEECQLVAEVDTPRERYCMASRSREQYFFTHASLA
jgi:hypothetical protein